MGIDMQSLRGWRRVSRGSRLAAPLLVAAVWWHASVAGEQAVPKQAAPKPAALAAAAALPASAPYGTGTWDPDTYGNHRAVIRVARKAEAVWAHIPWRRRDPDPDKKQILVVDFRANCQLKNVARPEVTREFSDIVFEALTPGEYHVYYMPYTGTITSNYTKITYRPPEATADGAWLARNVIGAAAGGTPRRKLLPRGRDRRVPGSILGA